jgi:hypothetical protein
MSKGIQNFIKGFLHRRTLKLDSITVDQLYVLNLYFLIVQGGITSKIVGEYEKAYPKESYPQYYEGVESKLYRILMVDMKPIIAIKKNSQQRNS